MRSPIRLRCPGCRARIKAPFQLLGKTRPCPQCGQRLVVQIQAPEDCGPMLSSDSLPDLPAARRRVSSNAESKVILVADDDLALNDGIRSVFEKRGYRVIQAFNGVQASELLRQQQPDLMVLDMMMPRMGGFPVLESVHHKSQVPPVIMITAKEGSQFRAYAQSLGVVDYIRKPFALERLLESVEKGLGIRQ
jgi:CheY-like chemotaxis protein